jgi:broad specificity phosphatase PhoE
LVCFCVWLLLAGARGQTELYFVRHGETVANATGRYNGKTINAFSALGAREVASLPSRLKGIRFDLAICSPSPRALRTAEPVLRALGIKAEVWPEFNECCTQIGAARRLAAHKNPLRTVGPVRLASDLARWFTLAPGHDQMIADGDYQDGLIVTRAATDRFVSYVGAGRHSVLVVGHSGQGGRFLEMLLGRAPVGRIRPGNTSIYHLRGSGKRWQLVSVSDFRG